MITANKHLNKVASSAAKRLDDVLPFSWRLHFLEGSLRHMFSASAHNVHTFGSLSAPFLCTEWTVMHHDAADLWEMPCTTFRPIDFMSPRLRAATSRVYYSYGGVMSVTDRLM